MTDALSSKSKAGTRLRRMYTNHANKQIDAQLIAMGGWLETAKMLDVELKQRQRGIDAFNEKLVSGKYVVLSRYSLADNNLHKRLKIGPCGDGSSFSNADDAAGGHTHAYEVVAGGFSTRNTSARHLTTGWNQSHGVIEKPVEAFALNEYDDDSAELLMDMFGPNPTKSTHAEDADMSAISRVDNGALELESMCQIRPCLTRSGELAYMRKDELAASTHWMQLLSIYGINNEAARQRCFDAVFNKAFAMLTTVVPIEAAPKLTSHPTYIISILINESEHVVHLVQTIIPHTSTGEGVLNGNKFTLSAVEEKGKGVVFNWDSQQITTYSPTDRRLSPISVIVNSTKDNPTIRIEKIKPTIGITWDKGRYTHTDSNNTAAPSMQTMYNTCITYSEPSYFTYESEGTAQKAWATNAHDATEPSTPTTTYALECDEMWSSDEKIQLAAFNKFMTDEETDDKTESVFSEMKTLNWFDLIPLTTELELQDDMWETNITFSFTPTASGNWYFGVTPCMQMDALEAVYACE